MADLSAIPVTVDHEGTVHSWRATTALAQRHQLTLYDAVYLEMAVRLRLRLATFDAALARAALAEGVSVMYYRAPLSATGTRAGLAWRLRAKPIPYTPPDHPWTSQQFCRLV